MKTSPNCACCKHFDINNNICSHKDGMLKNIQLNESLASAAHDCNVFEELAFRATPKGLLWLALSEADIDIADDKFNRIWDRFEDCMQRTGYIADDEEGSEE